jgi:ribosomal protein L21
MAGGVAEVTECLPSKCETLNSNSSATKKKKKKKKEREKGHREHYIFG